MWEEEGQGTVTGIGAVSWCGVLTSHHTLGLPRSDSSPIKCRDAGQATQTPQVRPLGGGGETPHSLKTGCDMPGPVLRVGKGRPGTMHGVRS